MESRVTRDLPVVPVVQVWMDVTEPEETRELTGFQESKDPKENWGPQDRRDFEEIKRCFSSRTPGPLGTPGLVDYRVCRVNRVLRALMDLVVLKDQTGSMVSLVGLVRGVRLDKTDDLWPA